MSFVGTHRSNDIDHKPLWYPNTVVSYVSARSKQQQKLHLRYFVKTDMTVIKTDNNHTYFSIKQNNNKGGKHKMEVIKNSKKFYAPKDHCRTYRYSHQ